MMEDLIHFISQYDLSFRLNISGATPDEINRLQALVKHDLPKSYLEFLESMGKTMDDIGFADIDFSIQTVIRFYEDARFAHPERYLFIAAHEQDPYSDIYLDLTTQDGQDCEAVCFESSEEEPAPEAIQKFHKRLSDMLFSNAFLCKRAGALAHHANLGVSPSELHGKPFDAHASLIRVEQIASKLGFHRIRHTSPEYLLMDRADAAIYAQSYGSPQFLIAALDEPEVARIRALISDHTPLF